MLIIDACIASLNTQRVKVMVRKIFIVFMFVSILVSCQNQENKPIEYDASVLSSVETLKVSPQNIPSNFSFADPQQISVLGDSLLVVFDETMNGKFAHVLRTNGDYVSSFGERGKAKGEMINPQNFSIGKDGKSVYFYDYTLTNTIKFNVDDLLKGNATPAIVNNHQITDKLINRFNNVWYFSDHSFVGFGYNDKCRILYVENNTIQDNYIDYPSLVEDKECNWSLWNNDASFVVSPDQKYVVISSGLGMVFEVLNIENGKISSHVVKGFYKAVYDVDYSTKPACVSYMKDTFEGCGSICVSNDGFYKCVLGSGPNFDQNDIIYFFDYNGNLIKKYKVPNPVVCMSKGKTNELYLITVNKNGENSLQKIVLNE